MKKTLLLGLGILASLTVSAQTTVAASELQWAVDNTWPGKVFNETGSGIDLTSGTGKTFNLTAWTSGGVADTIFASAPNDPAKADIKIKSSILGELDYKNTGADWALAGANAGGIFGFVSTDNYLATAGLPHNQGKTWSGTTVALGGLVTLSVAGDVLSEGTVTTSWGTFNCVLVKEVLTGAMAREAYYIETKEYGRVAAYVANQSKIWIMQSPIVINTEKVDEAKALNVFPNPASNVVNISATNAGALTIYNALGNAVKTVQYNGGNLTLDVANLDNGVYVVQLVSETGVETATVVVK